MGPLRVRAGTPAVTGHASSVCRQAESATRRRRDFCIEPQAAAPALPLAGASAFRLIIPKMDGASGAESGEKCPPMIARKSAPPGEEKKRRTERILLRVPIEVNGTGADGKPFTEKTYTLVVNRHGARVRLKRAVRPNDQVTITNPRPKMACPFRIVAKATDLLSHGPEWGREGLVPRANFGGSNLPGA